MEHRCCNLRTWTWLWLGFVFPHGCNMGTTRLIAGILVPMFLQMLESGESLWRHGTKEREALLNAAWLHAQLSSSTPCKYIIFGLEINQLEGKAKKDTIIMTRAKLSDI